MSKHTPGPWAWGNMLEEVEASAPDLAELVAYGPEDSKGNRAIIDVLGISGRDDDSLFKVSEADARLIACAPELLEALKGVLEDTLAPVNTLAMMRAEAIITKAEGTEKLLESRCTQSPPCGW